MSASSPPTATGVPGHDSAVSLWGCRLPDPTRRPPVPRCRTYIRRDPRGELSVEGDGTDLSATEPLARLKVRTDGQRGLLGVASDGDSVWAAWTPPDGRIVVGRVLPSPVEIVWAGPEASERANGGNLFFRDGALFVGIGDLEDPAAAGSPTSPNGKILRLDPSGRPNQARPSCPEAGTTRSRSSSTLGAASSSPTTHPGGPRAARGRGRMSARRDGAPCGHGSVGSRRTWRPDPRLRVRVPRCHGLAPHSR
ncbi:MAG: hypothetical protein DYH08_09080 [Actinobacteria bacterium ATB1]|nr:hypothetical protein [Actinobacteria bacterium ATB1]